MPDQWFPMKSQDFKWRFLCAHRYLFPRLWFSLVEGDRMTGRAFTRTSCFFLWRLAPFPSNVRHSPTESIVIESGTKLHSQSLVSVIWDNYLIKPEFWYQLYQNLEWAKRLIERRKYISLSWRSLELHFDNNPCPIPSGHWSPWLCPTKILTASVHVVFGEAHLSPILQLDVCTSINRFDISRKNSLVQVTFHFRSESHITSMVVTQ